MTLGMAGILALILLVLLYFVQRATKLTKKGKVIASVLIGAGLLLLIVYLIMGGILMAGIE